MVLKPNRHEDLTDNPEQAKATWRTIRRTIEFSGRQDILDDPNLTVLDIGGGMGELSKYINSLGIHCISLDRHEYDVPPEANPITADAHEMPFTDASFSIINAHGVFDPSQYRQDYPILLKEIARVTKKGGIFSIYGSDQPPQEEVEKYFKLISENPILFEKK